MPRKISYGNRIMYTYHPGASDRPAGADGLSAHPSRPRRGRSVCGSGGSEAPPAPGKRSGGDARDPDGQDGEERRYTN